jgi:hypothetical protein
MKTLKIEEMFAFVATDKDGEGVIGMQMPDGAWMPFVGADMERVESLKKMAKQIGRASHKKITLLKFTKRETVEEF